MVWCGDRYYDSFEALGNAILANLPRERQPVKWWRVRSKPNRFGHINAMPGNRLQKMLRILPRISWSRTWVGYLFIHLYLLNRWCFLIQLGHYERCES